MMDWAQVITMVVIIGGMLFAGGAYIHSDIKEIKQGLQQQGARTDRLYEMFIDLLKERNK